MLIYLNILEKYIPVTFALVCRERYEAGTLGNPLPIRAKV